ncbi:sigma 54-interacting transcriptional regulator [Desulfofustis glycolicus]|uniref:Two component, sigma54 specific, transcriptional regulator, Fis family n=1 Tax=Desulfofustis glycolicus DSM 9705 TaxID=1121409 RepID=A0A1M5Y3E4_9BACT|nr:sigma 54-interacting transcriptional regulator [Desulfofustis glycolicus]MCB2214852.1 sigma 54-interacting transcriptional regulator [Desulfobulbaceae bacterium]SHI06324.1 two component, sigma54 specific, transcriptional regulator, Fis family [Desulfofustis glycolicus DSM 9705]
MDKATILLVDDEDDLLSLWTLRLENAGYRVVTARSGEEAMAVFSASPPQLVITDLRMEKMNGLNLYEAIRKVNTSIPVLIITAHGSIPEAVDATQKGVFAFLTKPIDGKILLAEIERALRAASSGGAAMAATWRKGIISRSAIMEQLLDKVRLVARSNASVLIRGQSGTGKELLAKALHRASDRAEKPFVPVNCSAIPEALLESELFGHAKGSFSGADRAYEGLFRAADNGTLFLDEIGDMPLPLQVKLLRVLQEKQVRPVGDTVPIDVNVRIISATHQNLEQRVAENRFREDLYYRLNVVTLEVPPLQDRREDIPMLVEHFLSLFNEQNDRTIVGFSPEAMDALLEAPWPGNIRQLQNVVEQAAALSTTDLIPVNLISSALREETVKILSFDEARFEFGQRYLVRLLQMTGGNVARAARIAERNRTDFYKILNRHHISPHLFKNER